MLKNTFYIALAVLVSMALFTGNALAAPSAQETKLGQGAVQVYDFGSIKLHAYQSFDPMSDESFALETSKNIVAIESPAFDVNIAEWKAYLDGLGKPLTDILISYHPAGGNWFGKARSHATAVAKQAMSSGATRSLTDSLGQTFGAGFNTEVPRIDSILKAGMNTIGGIEFEIIEAGDGYDIAIPSINLVYTHMLGADTHSILAGQEHIAVVLASLENMKAKGYQLILSSHHIPETLEDVASKIAYVKDIQEIVGKSSGKDDFVARVVARYPDYKGLNYLEMTAGFFFAE